MVTSTFDAQVRTSLCDLYGERECIRWPYPLFAVTRRTLLGLRRKRSMEVDKGRNPKEIRGVLTAGISSAERCSKFGARGGASERSAGQGLGWHIAGLGLAGNGFRWRNTSCRKVLYKGQTQLRYVARRGPGLSGFARLSFDDTARIFCLDAVSQMESSAIFKAQARFHGRSCPFSLRPHRFSSSPNVERAP